MIIFLHNGVSCNDDFKLTFVLYLQNISVNSSVYFSETSNAKKCNGLQPKTLSTFGFAPLFNNSSSISVPFCVLKFEMLCKIVGCSS